MNYTRFVFSRLETLKMNPIPKKSICTWCAHPILYSGVTRRDASGAKHHFHPKCDKLSREWKFGEKL